MHLSMQIPTHPLPGNNGDLSVYQPSNPAPGVGLLHTPSIRSLHAPYTAKCHVGCALFRIPKPNTADMAENTAENIPVAEKKVVVTLGKRKRIVAFKSEASESDKSIVIKRIREEFRDRLKDDRCEIVLQMKNVEVDDFIEVGDGDVIEDKAILEFFTEQSDVREFLNS